MLSQKLYEYTTGTLSYDAEMIFYNGVELENWQMPDFMIRKLIESKTIREILLPYITKGNIQTSAGQVQQTTSVIFYNGKM